MTLAYHAPAVTKRAFPKRKYKKLQDWEVQAIADAYKGGEKIIAIANEFSCHTTTVCRICNGRGLSRRPIWIYKKLQDWEIQAIAAAYKDGEKLDAIASKFQCSKSTVCRIGTLRGMSRKPDSDKRIAHYSAVGFDADLRNRVQAVARKKRCGFGKAARLLIEQGLTVEARKVPVTLDEDDEAA